MNVLQNIFRRGGPKDKKDKGERKAIHPISPDHQKVSNSTSELQLLTGHTDIVRLLEQIDDNRIASAADDGRIFIWEPYTGALIHQLEGHTRQITCLLLVERDTLISGSADKTIRIWDLLNGTCSNVLKNCHQGSVKCITRVDATKFCSGGNDRYLCIWKNSGELVGTIERQEEENLHCLLAIPKNRIITGSNSSILLVYKTDTLKFCKLLAYHRESVRCLININVDLFVSASLDGAIVVWQTETLSPLKKLNYPDKFRSAEGRVYIYSVHHLLKLSDSFVAACIGNGFRIYDIYSGDCIMECTSAHNANVLQLISIYFGTRLVTCSADSSIRIWGSKEQFNFRKPPYSNSSRPGSTSRIKSRRSKSVHVHPICLGEMFVHSDSVNALLPLNEFSFASAGHDNLVILWKDGKIQSEKRNQDAKYSLQKYNQFFQELYLEDELEFTGDGNLVVNDFTEKLSTSSKLESVPVPQPNGIDIKDNSDKQKNSQTNSGQSSSEDYDKNEVLNRRRAVSAPHAQPTKKVPKYILDHAEMLRTERKLSIEEISTMLRDDGHSEAIVKAIAEKQRQASNAL